MKRIIILSLMLLCFNAFSQNGQIKTTTGIADNFYYKDGKIGIGISEPETKLHIGVPHGYNQDEEIRLGSHYQNKFFGIGLNYRINSTGSVSKHLVEYHGGVRYTAMSIMNGKIGVGVSDPRSKLHVGVPHGYNQDEEIRLGSYYKNKFFGIGLNYRINSTGSVSKHLVEYHSGVRYTAMSIMNGNIGIGTASPDYKLDVLGTIRARELKVDMQGADFVFEENYPLRPISELEDFVKANKHLPEIAPAKEMQANGVNQSEMNQKLLQKIEELTLYLIEQNKKTNKVIEENKELRKEIEVLKLK